MIFLKNRYLCIFILNLTLTHGDAGMLFTEKAQPSSKKIPQQRVLK